MVQREATDKDRGFMMNINILQLKDAHFKSKLHWWSCWVDAAVFNYEYTPFLLQMKISRINKKAFNAICITGKHVYRQATCKEIGDLVSMERGADGK